jgi:3-oxoacyl-[acyl-carrier-protein] synthase III
MFLIGVSTISPTALISDADLNRLIRNKPSENLSTMSGVRSRRISLPFDYINFTGNVDPLEGWKVATASPTSLAVQAVKELLSNHGVAIEQIGLALGDTGTPYQTCPSEAQRVMGEFGVKTPAFDLVGGIGALPHALSVISRWNSERLPDYLLYITTSTPSQQVNYHHDPDSAALFGDAAVALLFAKSVPAGASLLRKVSYAKLSPEDKRRMPVIVEKSARLNKEALVSEEYLERFIADELDSLRRVDSKLIESALFIPPQLYAARSAEILARLSVSRDRIMSGVEDVGFALGASYGVALAKIWGDLKPGSPIVLMHCGDGQRGSVVLSAS